MIIDTELAIWFAMPHSEKAQVYF